jgi:fido (protein-threonine AMPylation protein)
MTDRADVFIPATHWMPSGLACLGIAVLAFGGKVTAQALAVDFPFGSDEFGSDQLEHVSSVLGILLEPVGKDEVLNKFAGYPLIIKRNRTSFVFAHHVSVDLVQVRDPERGIFDVKAESFFSTPSEAVWLVRQKGRLRKERDILRPSYFWMIEADATTFPNTINFAAVAALDLKYRRDIAYRLNIDRPQEFYSRYTEEIDKRLDRASAGSAFPNSCGFATIHTELYDGIVSHAGGFRAIDLCRNRVMFVRAERVPEFLDRLLPLILRSLSDCERHELPLHLARAYSDLNSIHAFNDGNGRVNMTFLRRCLATRDLYISIGGVPPAAMYRAASLAHLGDVSELQKIFKELVG